MIKNNHCHEMMKQSEILYNSLKRIREIQKLLAYAPAIAKRKAQKGRKQEECHRHSDSDNLRCEKSNTT